jgi:hypothetical protein
MFRGVAARQKAAHENRFTRGSTALLAVLTSVLPSLAAVCLGDDKGAPSYERDVKPLFAKRCSVCHRASKRDNPDISGGLALDTYEGVLEGTSRRKVIVRGRAGASELWQRLADPDLDRRMPLDDTPLPQAQQDLIRRWIEAGAPRGIALAERGRSRAATLGAQRQRRPRLVPALDVVLESDAKLAPERAGAGAGSALAVALKIGPLPAVTALAFRGDSRLLAVGTYEEVVAWDLHDAQPACAVRDIPGAVHALAFSRDGRRLAVGAGLPARSGSVQVYTIPDGTKIHDFAGHQDVVTALALRPDGAQLASASFDQTIRFWNLGENRPEGTFTGHADFVYAVAYAPDGRALFSASKDRTIKRINSRTLKQERTYSDHNDEILALDAHPSGKRFVSAGNEPQIRWWAIDSDRPVSRRAGHSASVQQLAFSADGQRLISAGADGFVRVWHGKTGELLRQLAGAGDWQYAVAISADGRLAAAGGCDGLVRVWDAATGRLRATLIQPPGDRGGPESDARPSGAPWFALSPSGHVNGSPDLLLQAQWRAGTTALPSHAAREAFASAGSLAQALRGEPLKSVLFRAGAGK